MTSRDEFEASLAAGEAPGGLSRPLLALWHARKGDWDRAHELAQAAEGDPAHDWIHAYLHREEGDTGNAAYWYRRAGKPVADGGLEEEWRRIVDTLIAA